MGPHPEDLRTVEFSHLHFFVIIHTSELLVEDVKVFRGNLILAWCHILLIILIGIVLVGVLHRLFLKIGCNAFEVAFKIKATRCVTSPSEAKCSVLLRLARISNDLGNSAHDGVLVSIGVFHDRRKSVEVVEAQQFSHICVLLLSTVTLRLITKIDYALTLISNALLAVLLALANGAFIVEENVHALALKVLPVPQLLSQKHRKVALEPLSVV